ncbi:MAG: lytic murein transglycosylase B [Methyloprofundus sp.]|nr:lytic murein transglycosylase B [Methyloprofundus sp.]
MKKLAITLLLAGFIGAVHAEIKATTALDGFISKMAKQHAFDKAELQTLFQSVETQDSIIKAMNRPAEGMPWFKYRKIFMRDTRINGGVKFWQENQATLKAVQEKYGVPAEIIVAIIGVETLYGERTGGYRVIDALATLGFSYPKRSQFFLSELEHFLILCREEKVNPLEPVGSYAGAMGMPQFMPSSYRHYAADFEEDGQRDIWKNPADTIASVANYFSKHHWKAGEAVAYPVKAEGTAYKKALTKGLKPDTTPEQLTKLNIKLPVLKAKEPLKLLSFEQESGADLWVGLTNFYVITRYNHSSLYALAVFQVSEAIRDAYTRIESK